MCFISRIKNPDNYKYQLKNISGIPSADVIPEEVANLLPTVGVNDRKTYKYVEGQFSLLCSSMIVDQIVPFRYTPDPRRIYPKTL